MQLSLPTTLLFALLLWPTYASAQSSFDATTTVFHESGGPLNTTVLNPKVAARAQVIEALSVQAGWEADVVTGASVAVVDGPVSEVDAISSATTYNDFRQVIRGGLGLSSDNARIDASYSHGFERDYRSHTLAVRARTELFDRNTVLEIALQRSWDEVCDLLQPDAEKPVERQRLPNAQGCFEPGKGRAIHTLALHGLQGTWTQAWTPIFNTQLLLSAQLINGFQSNPYRMVWLGRRAAQEHHPENRGRYAVGLNTRIWMRPLGGALQTSIRGYRDTWDVLSLTAEVAFERSLGAYFRMRLRGRHYRQTGAAFYSDDYALSPVGQYFTGDRELSRMSSWLAGGRLDFLPTGDREAKALGFIENVRIVLKADVLMYQFPDFHYGTADVPNTRAIFGTLGVETVF